MAAGQVLVTGAGGLVGRAVAAALAGNGRAVIATWRDAPVLLDGVETLRLDLADAPAVEKALSGRRIDAVVHAAARLAAGPLDRLAADNVVATGALAQAARAAGCRRFVFCSSISVYGVRGAPRGGYREAQAEPSNFYGWSKRAAELLLDTLVTPDDSMTSISLRFAGIHGGDRTGGALHAMTRAALAGDPIRVAEPDSRFRWLFLDDAVQAVRRALDADLGPSHHIANVASADIFGLASVAARVRRLSRSASPIQRGSDRPARNEVMNIGRATALLGFRPTPLAEALPAYVAAVRAAGALAQSA